MDLLEGLEGGTDDSSLQPKIDGYCLQRFRAGP
jgi:hypothetical protein